jgi:hypothetical protein
VKFINRKSDEDGRGIHHLELTRRNLTTLLAKLDDPLSARSLMDGEGRVVVTAVEDDAHYSNRAPGTIFMPSTGEYI